eukprot:4193310-Prymnesium_polylepis.1
MPVAALPTVPHPRCAPARPQPGVVRLPGARRGGYDAQHGLRAPHPRGAPNAAPPAAKSGARRAPPTLPSDWRRPTALRRQLAAAASGEKRQTIMFSATWPASVQRVARQLMRAERALI